MTSVLSPHPFCSQGEPAEQPESSGSDQNNAIVLAVYILYGIGFFFHITALIGFIMAYVYGRDETGKNKLHFEFQKGIFKVGLCFFFLMIFLSANLAFSFALFDLGPHYENTALFCTISATSFLCIAALYWFIWTIMAILFGLKASSANEAPTAETILGISPLPKKYRRNPSLN